MAYYEDEQTDKAVRAYLDYHDRRGTTAVQPSRSESGTEPDARTVVLRSGGRELARYRVKPDGSLRRLAATAVTDAFSKFALS